MAAASIVLTMALVALSASMLFYWASRKSPLTNIGIAVGIVLLLTGAVLLAIRLLIRSLLLNS